VRGYSRWIGNFVTEKSFFGGRPRLEFLRIKVKYCMWRIAMRDADFLRAMLETSILYVDMVEQAAQSNKQGKKSKATLKFSFCDCQDCENLKWIAHSNKRKRLILVSKKAFEKELTNKVNRGMGFFIIIYALMHAYLQILHPYSSEKTIRSKASRYFKKSMQVVAKDGFKVIMNKVSV
jgi:hypothetical protein